MSVENTSGTVIGRHCRFVTANPVAWKRHGRFCNSGISTEIVDNRALLNGSAKKLQTEKSALLKNRAENSRAPIGTYAKESGAARGASPCCFEHDP
jgi:hypothetical protein